jgi:metallopeptidase MepB
MNEDGTQHYPLVLVSCSFPQPTNRPTQLDYPEIVSLFHTIGYAIHSLVSRNKYSRLHGSNSPVDYTQIPGQVLENWFWDPATLKKIGRHYSYISPKYLEVWERTANEAPRPPERLSDDAVKYLCGRSYSNNVFHQLLTLHRSLFDIIVHQPNNHEAVQNINLPEIWNRLNKELMQMEDFEAFGLDSNWGHGYTSLGCFNGNYAAGYYSYLL